MTDRTAYFQEYYSRPEVVAANRAKARRQADAKKLENLRRKIKSQSLDNLLKIAKKQCEEKNLDWESQKDKIQEVFEIFN